MKKKQIAIGTAILIITVLIYAARYLFPLEVDPAVSFKNETPADTLSVPLAEPEMLYGFEIDSLIVIEDKVRRNQTLSTILAKYNVDHETIYGLSEASKGIFDVRKMLPNRKITFILNPDSIQTLRAVVYEPSDLEYVIFNLIDSLHVEKKSKETKRFQRVAAGIIHSSLAVTMDDLNLSPQLTNDFADIFAWQIDFFHLYPGDKFNVFFEEETVDGHPVGIATIKGAYFKHAGNDFYAIYYDQGNGYDFFDEEGNSLRKELLRYPVKFSRISSRYSGSRYHPVQKRWKAHRGTDFVAPQGTPIRSVGDGIIQVAQYHQFNGNYVKVKHNGNYITGYLHMVKIASGIRPGTQVKQGQVIGYVGKTGLANGNHVCFRFWKNGVQIDAMKVQLPPSEPIKKENLIDFNAYRDIILSTLDAISFVDAELLFARKEQ